MPYIDKMDPTEQVDMEEAISSVIYEKADDVYPKSLHEEDCAELGRKILHMVLTKFRPDLVRG